MPYLAATSASGRIGSTAVVEVVPMAAQRHISFYYLIQRRRRWGKTSRPFRCSNRPPPEKLQIAPSPLHLLPFRHQLHKTVDPGALVRCKDFPPP
ncbi:hypothetical protein Tsubulata_034574 [Turnera subulata]|uniref:Uncharacterized protein n=1 Tax=Turnera subulata TaxID=218843 RepID=A0A9Q0FE14_9ROSI|nr:hypothetical protein Tsubulata_034574 [Turnera subulata]